MPDAAAAEERPHRRAQAAAAAAATAAAEAAVGQAAGTPSRLAGAVLLPARPPAHRPGLHHLHGERHVVASAADL